MRLMWRKLFLWHEPPRVRRRPSTQTRMTVLTKSEMANRYSPEIRAGAVRMVFEHQGSCETQTGAITAIAPGIGCIPLALSERVKQAGKDSGICGDLRGKAMKTAIPDTSAPCPRDRMNPVFRAAAPNLLWVNNFTCASTRQGFACAAFVILRSCGRRKTVTGTG